MKKFISMVMAAAMVVSLVPATAFAANTATFKVVNDQEYTEAEAKTHDSVAGTDTKITGPELQIKVKDVDTKLTSDTTADDFDITLDFDNAEFADKLDKVTATLTETAKANKKVDVTVKETADKGDDTVKLKITEKKDQNLDTDDIITINLEDLGLILTKTSKNTKATVEVSGDFGDSDALTFASVLDTGIKVTLKKVAEVAEEETTKLEKDLTIKSAVSDFVKGQRFELKLNSGFEFTKACDGKTGDNYKIETTDDENKIIVTVTKVTDEIVISKDHIEIDAVDAKVGAVAKLTVKALAGDDKGNELKGSFKATADAVEAAKVVDNAVTLEVDEDEDVPVIYSGVNTDNFGITDDSDHKSLEVTLKESAKGALDVKKSFTLTLPEGVYATDVDVTDAEGTFIAGKDMNTNAADVEDAFAAAYKKGDQDNFEFARKTFLATDDSKNTTNDDMSLDFKMTLIAEPGFEGDVTLTLGGDAFDKEQEVVIAKFVSPYKVEASQNDMIIDYRNTKVPTNVVIKEAEAGLWKKDDMTFEFEFDKDIIELEDDATITVDDKSDMEVKNTKDMKFTVKDESDDEAATVTISDISLYMNRSIAAGAYNLKLKTTAGTKMMTENALFTTKAGETGTERSFHGVTVKPYYAADYRDWDVKSGDFVEKSFTVKEGFVNVITAGRDQDDASFTKKVVVPVGESYLIAGEEQVALDVPAYISADGYTMLPVRAVATALGINNNNVLWNQATKTVTILYGQRIITMVAGQKVVTVNGNTIPASATVQIVNGRTFLPMRDLATALGVTDITWDAATKTATMNGNQNK